MGSSRPLTARLAEKLLNIRTSFDLSQSQMVELLKSQEWPEPLRLYAGNISRFEQSLREPPLLVLLAYARATNISIDILIDARLDLPQRLIANASLTKTQKSRSAAPARTAKRKTKATAKKRIRNGRAE
jgi:transcriptional regulator with XRE-family HTH domain